MENRINCPYCMEEGEILTAVCDKTNERIYMCDKCKDIWETFDLTKDKAISHDVYMLKMNKQDSDFITWEYVIR